MCGTECMGLIKKRIARFFSDFFYKCNTQIHCQTSRINLLCIIQEADETTENAKPLQQHRIRYILENVFLESSFGNFLFNKFFQIGSWPLPG